MSDERMKRARALYLAVYESQGGKWEANDCKELWCEKADRYLELAGASVAQSTWQPIETAPKEGRFLVCGMWLGEQFVTEARAHSPLLWKNIEPTHWRPMPDGPSVSSTQGNDVEKTGEGQS